MARFNFCKKDLVYFVKDGKPTIAVVVEAYNAHNISSLFVLTQDGVENHIYDLYDRKKLGYTVKQITDRVYNKLTPEQQEVVDNFDFDKAVRNYRKRMWSNHN